MIKKARFWQKCLPKQQQHLLTGPNPNEAIKRPEIRAVYLPAAPKALNTMRFSRTEMDREWKVRKCCLRPGTFCTQTQTWMCSGDWTASLQLVVLKGIVQPKMKLLSLFTHSHVVPNLHAFIYLFYETQKKFWVHYPVGSQMYKCSFYIFHIGVLNNDYITFNGICRSDSSWICLLNIM